MQTILLPNGNLIIPADPDDPDDGPGVREIGPEHPDFGKWLAVAEPGEDLRPGGGKRGDDETICSSPKGR